MKIHNPDTVSAVVEPYTPIYSHAIETETCDSRQLYMSGQVGVHPSGELKADFIEQFTQAIENVEAILASADMTPQDIVKVTYYLTRREDLADLISVRQQRWHGIRPAVTVVLVAGLVHPDWLIEVDVIAQKEI